MAIQRPFSSSVIACLACFHGICGYAAGSLTFDDPPAGIRPDAAAATTMITVEQAEREIAALQRDLQTCQDDDIAARLKYRIGIAYFKGGMLAEARDTFQRTAEQTCPTEVKLLCLNMIGLTSRLTGSSQEALDALAQLILVGQRALRSDTSGHSDPVCVRLLCLAWFGRAEIHDLEGHLDQTVIEYSQLLDFLDRIDEEEVVERYRPLALDRLSQSHLRVGNIEKYFVSARTLTARHPQYYRTPLVKLEMICLEFLTSAVPAADLCDGSHDLPVKLIARLHQQSGQVSSQQVVGALKALCDECPRGYGGILANYHYAWVLDATGDTREAAKVMQRVVSMEAPEEERQSPCASLIRIVQDYARIQRALILSEQADYREARRILLELDKGAHSEHVLGLRQSVGKSTETLKKGGSLR